MILTFFNLGRSDFPDASLWIHPCCHTHPIKTDKLLRSLLSFTKVSMANCISRNSCEVTKPKR